MSEVKPFDGRNAGGNSTNVSKTTVSTGKLLVKTNKMKEALNVSMRGQMDDKILRAAHKIFGEERTRMCADMHKLERKMELQRKNFKKQIGGLKITISKLERENSRLEKEFGDSQHLASVAEAHTQKLTEELLASKHLLTSLRGHCRTLETKLKREIQSAARSKKNMQEKMVSTKLDAEKRERGLRDAIDTLRAHVHENQIYHQHEELKHMKKAEALEDRLHAVVDILEVNERSQTGTLSPSKHIEGGSLHLVRAQRAEKELLLSQKSVVKLHEMVETLRTKHANNVRACTCLNAAGCIASNMNDSRDSAKPSLYKEGGVRLVNDKKTVESTSAKSTEEIDEDQRELLTKLHLANAEINKLKEKLKETEGKIEPKKYSVELESIDRIVENHTTAHAINKGGYLDKEGDPESEEVEDGQSRLKNSFHSRPVILEVRNLDEKACVVSSESELLVGVDLKSLHESKEEADNSQGEQGHVSHDRVTFLQREHSIKFSSSLVKDPDIRYCEIGLQTHVKMFDKSCQYNPIVEIQYSGSSALSNFESEQESLKKELVDAKQTIYSLNKTIKGLESVAKNNSLASELRHPESGHRGIVTGPVVSIPPSVRSAIVHKTADTQTERLANIGENMNCSTQTPEAEIPMIKKDTTFSSFSESSTKSMIFEEKEEASSTLLSQHSEINKLNSSPVKEMEMTTKLNSVRAQLKHVLLENEALRLAEIDARNTASNLRLYIQKEMNAAIEKSSFATKEEIAESGCIKIELVEDESEEVKNLCREIVNLKQEYAYDLEMHAKEISELVSVIERQKMTSKTSNWSTGGELNVMRSTNKSLLLEIANKSDETAQLYQEWKNTERAKEELEQRLAQTMSQLSCFSEIVEAAEESTKCLHDNLREQSECIKSLESEKKFMLSRMQEQALTIHRLTMN